ncbi:hypothetical protein [Streptomyces sp. NPDC058308]|uniref:hypothetical protein n=1 Tax=Streptomyces sp. NPDC058308 TaxID=3346440 RepID=UPI0036E02153
MELRDRLERHAVLADMYCEANERVVDAQLTLEELRKNRNRVLAALAVTLGSDTGAAHVLGLPERDVRTARKSVNREEALDLATNALELLAAETAAVPTASYADRPPAAAEPFEAQDAKAAPEPVSHPPEPAATPPPARETVAMPAPTPAPATAQAPVAAPQPPVATAAQPAPAAAPAAPHVQVAAPTSVPEAVSWTAPMDHLLVQGWHEGVNPSVLATQLGCDLPALALRVQELSYAESAPAQAASAQAHVRTGGDTWEPAQAPSRQPGRHRRHRANGTSHGLFPQETMSHQQEACRQEACQQDLGYHPSHAPQGQPAGYHLPYGDVQHAFSVGM